MTEEKINKIESMVEKIIEQKSYRIITDSSTENDGIGHYECHGYKGNDIQPDYLAGGTTFEWYKSMPLELTKQDLKEYLKVSHARDFLDDIIDMIKEVYDGEYPEWDKEIEVYEDKISLGFLITYTSGIHREEPDYNGMDD